MRMTVCNALYTYAGKCIVFVSPLLSSPLLSLPSVQVQRPPHDAPHVLHLRPGRGRLGGARGQGQLGRRALRGRLRQGRGRGGEGRQDGEETYAQRQKSPSGFGRLHLKNDCITFYNYFFVFTSSVSSFPFEKVISVKDDHVTCDFVNAWKARTLKTPRAFSSKTNV